MESNKESLQRHFYIALGLALGLRLVCLHFVWGPQALDDYLDNIIPAWRYIHGADSGLHDYRSPLYLFILAGWLKIGLGIGLTEAISQIQWVYLLQGTCSLLCVVAIYEWVKNWSDQRAASWALYLVAAHGILPFASTRSFMESFAMGFLSLGLVLMQICTKFDNSLVIGKDYDFLQKELEKIRSRKIKYLLTKMLKINPAERSYFKELLEVVNTL